MPRFPLVAAVALAGLLTASCVTFRQAHAEAVTPVKFDCSAALTVPEATKLLADKKLTVAGEPLGDCYAAANLNASGQNELLMVLTGSFYSGSGGQPLYIFTRDAGAWQMIADGGQYVFMENVGLAATKTKGFNDVVARGSDGSKETVRLQFDGAQYKPAKLAR